MMKTLWKETLKLWLFTGIKIPLIAYLRPRIVSVNDEQAVVRIPLSRRSRNHVGSMYFGALSVGADLVPGVLALRHIGKHKPVCTFVFKDFTANFLKRCEGDAYFFCDDGALIASTIEKAIASEERQTVTVSVAARTSLDELAEPVALFKLSISIKA